MIDYLQLMSPDKENQQNRERAVAEISGGLKALAKDVYLPVICCSQLRRSDDSSPELSDLRDSGAIEQDADLVAFVFRKEVVTPGKPELAGLAELQVKKHRNGPTGTQKLKFLKESAAFRYPLSYGETFGTDPEYPDDPPPAREPYND
jgi:replicative DNA helicase